MKTGRSLLASCVLIAGVTAGAFARSSPSLSIASGGKASAVIVVDEGAEQSYRYAASQLQKYLQDLSGVQISIIGNLQISAQPRQETLIFVGGHAVNPPIASA